MQARLHQLLVQIHAMLGLPMVGQKLMRQVMGVFAQQHLQVLKHLRFVMKRPTRGQLAQKFQPDLYLLEAGKRLPVTDIKRRSEPYSYRMHSGGVLHCAWRRCGHL